ncbi:alpha/beta fold hydrolase [Paenibacillus pabuli]|uniref:alpha/beta fold hydrolase n=1 Tax=Paenibacillus pabuli TaxID=1472 RepID=UPI003CED9569
MKGEKPDGLSSSPSNTPPPFDRTRFPQVTIYDNVTFQHRLVTEKFGIQKIALVVGWSMGGIQAFQWGASYPDMVERIAPIAGMAKTWPHTFVVLNGVIAPLLAASRFDANQQENLTSVDLRGVGRVYAGWGLSQAFYREELYRGFGYDSLADFVSGFWEEAFMQMDPHNVLAMLWTGQFADISANPLYNGNFDEALQSITARACIMPGATDLFCTAADNEYEAQRMPNAVFSPIDSIWGHFAGRGMNSVDNQYIEDSLRELLAYSVDE